ncbi:hypothetical protein EJ05DRAFT_446756, partial [Pseudovirgaria hyperparasitica]
VRNPTYGVLVHGIRTHSIDMVKFEQNREDMLHENKPFIPRADIKFMGWLTRKTPSKSASSVIIDFTRPEDANKIIDEGLIWQGEVFQCERYERQYCPEKFERTASRKCANCHADHEAWNRICPIRKDELAKTKEAYAMRSHYHPRVALPRSTALSGMTEPVQGRGQKRTNTGTTLVDQDMTATEEASASQRPQRTLVPSRRALEARESGTLRGTASEQMDIDRGTVS